MPLHTLHRPTSLDEIIGNEALIQSLESVLSRGSDWPHAYLITGPKGCGKTTIGRIILQRLHVAERDVIEMNAADDRGINTIRRMITQSRLSPLFGENRGWLLDECHQIMSTAQEAMLKLIEEPPKHVYFVLCTTEPAGLLETIKSRCHKYQVQALTYNQIDHLLRQILKKEKFSVPEDVLAQICKDSNGSARDALVSLDSIIDMESTAMLGAVQQKKQEQSEIIDLCVALMERSPWKKIAKILAGMKKSDPEQVRRAVMGFCSYKLLEKENLAAWLIMEAFKDPVDRNGQAGIAYAAYTAIQAIRQVKT